MAVLDGEIIKAVIEFVLDNGAIIQNVLHFIAEFTSNQTDADVVDACETYADELYEDVEAYIDQNVTVNPLPVHVVAWNDVDDEWFTQRLLGTGTLTINPGSTADPLPNQNAAVLVGNTGRPKSRGRKFLAPFEDTAAVGSEWGAPVLTNLVLALAHYLADETVVGENKLSPGVPRANEDTFLPFTDGIVNSVVGSQRRRKLGVGA